MNAIKSLFLFAFTCIIGLNAFSQAKQDDDKLSLYKGTIDNQFEYILRKSGNFKGTNGQPYEAVKLSNILALRAHTIDSLRTVHKNLAETQAVVKRQVKEISALKSNLSNTQIELDKTNTEKNNMALFGMQMSKIS